MADVDPYPITSTFERQIVALACSRPRFYGRVAYALQPDAMPSELARLAIRAAHEIHADTGKGPERAGFVIQRMRRWQDAGRVTADQINAVDDYIAEAEDAGLPSDDAVAAELLPLLQRRLRNAALHIAATEHAKGGDMKKVIELLSQADSLGITDSTIGVRLGGSSFDVIASLRFLERLPTGISELDHTLGGGLPRGQLGFYMGGAGDGKSMALSQQAAHSTMAGLFVGYATYELAVPTVLARIKAAITGITIDAILAGSDEAKAKIEAVPLGPCIVKEFTPQVTPIEALFEWVKQCEEDIGRPMDLLICDYADKIALPKKYGEKDSGQYKGMEIIYESLRTFVAERKMWGWTASQGTRPSKDQKKKIDLEHVSDSMGKVRVADLVISLNVRGDEGEEMMLWIAKNRTGQSRRQIGPLPTDFACGLVAPLTRPMLQDSQPSGATAAVSELWEPGANG